MKKVMGYTMIIVALFAGIYCAAVSASGTVTKGPSCEIAKTGDCIDYAGVTNAELKNFYKINCPTDGGVWSEAGCPAAYFICSQPLDGLINCRK